MSDEFLKRMRRLFFKRKFIRNCLLIDIALLFIVVYSSAVAAEGIM